MTRQIYSITSPSVSQSSLNRRLFLRQTTLAGIAVAFPFVSRRNVLGANDRLNIAGIGVGGKGWVDVTQCDTENIVALCDVDDRNAAKTYERFPDARRFRDYRKMFDAMAGEIDAVTISTPDHMHFHPAMRAVREGKHVFCQKPLTHTVWEARELTRAARDAGVATQMGNQGISHRRLRRDAELIRAGTIGMVQEIHCWTDRPGNWWRQAIPRPQETPPVPGTLDWDLWLGCAPERPYHPNYVPFHWRGFWDFGTGAIGDMGCHLLNLATLGMVVRDPRRVEAISEGANHESGPSWSIITWQFPQIGSQPPYKFVWYDGGKRAPQELFPAVEFGLNGLVMVGDRDSFYVPGWDGGGTFRSGATYDDYSHIPEVFEKSDDWDRIHYLEWIRACKGGPRAISNFDVSGPVTEVVLLGNVAIRVGHAIEWDSTRLEVTNCKEGSRLLRTDYRQGWPI